MIRTRDFFLYICIFAFVLMGILFTIKSNSAPATNMTARNTEVSFAGGTDGVGVGDSNDINRASNLAILREKLAAGAGEISQGEPVLTSVDTPTTTATDPVVETVIIVSNRMSQYCAVLAPYTMASIGWPTSGLEKSTSGGIISYTGPSAIEVTVGSSTEMQISQKTYLRLPTEPFRGLQSHCLDSEVIGVANDNSLLKNSDTWRFRTATADTLIGRARDGFPIYGSGVDESLLDSCGGYDNGVSYRYHIREQELFLLGCYAATPQPFLD